MSIFIGVNDPRLLMRAHTINPAVDLPPALMASCHCSACGKSAELEIMARERADAEAEKRRKVFRSVAENLGLPTFADGDMSPGEASNDKRFEFIKSGLQPIKSRETSKAPLKRGPAGIKEQAARRIHKLLGLQAMNDDGDDREAEEIFAMLGLKRK